jgi:regulator of sigma E protease
MLFTIIVFLAVFSVLVFAHELGHFLTAKKFGVKAEEFGFGYPPRIVGIYRNSAGQCKIVWGSREVKDAPGTVYSLNLLPLGGFVKIKGEDDNGDKAADSFAAKKIWQRATMLSAGVVMNIVLAMFLIIIGFMIGIPQVIDGVDARAKILDERIQIVEVMKGSPAETAGVQMGDIIKNIDGVEFSNYFDLQSYVDSHVNQELNYLIERGGQEVGVIVTPEIRPETEKGGIGVSITETGIVKYPWHLAIWEGIKTTFYLFWVILVAFYELFKNLFVGQGLTQELTGPVGIAVLTGQVAHMGFVYILQFTALFSINLAIINFLPIPALDGGRVLFLIIEKIKGSPVKRELEAALHNIGFALLMLLVIVVTYRDVLKFSGKFLSIWGK